MEISPGYCDVVVRRMTENQTGFEARLAETGQSFEQVSVGRRLAAEAALQDQEGAAR
jgi:hypothetical protein